MDGNHGSDPLHDLDGVDWDALVPEHGGRIPDLLRGVSGERQEEALVELHGILAFPGPGYVAAPAVVEFLMRMVAQEGLRGRHNVLNLVQELAVPAMADHLPVRRDSALWRDEVAWAVGADAGTLREQYEGWLAEAPDEQRHRRMSGRLRALSHDGGAAVLAAELAVHDAVRERLPVLLGLLEGKSNRGGDAVAEWASYILAWFPEDADEIVPAILSAGDPLAADTDLRPLPAEMWAVGMLADPADVTVTVQLGQLLVDSDEDLSFAAALALGQIHGSAAPEQAIARLLNAAYWEDQFGVCLPQSGGMEPAHLGMLALGAVDDEEVQRAKIHRLPRVFAYTGAGGHGAVAADALELAFGPRVLDRAPAKDGDFDGYDQDRRDVLTAIADIGEQEWQEGGLTEVLRAWGLPEERTALRAFTGADAEADAPAEPEAPAAPAAAEPGGLLGRLFGGR
ncbi:hypothetical protein [Actinorugispora endophytica]|uniref:HEAT repeat protein n=1 Tax=Actinorugispora endophytica TaxID=1605990 RepID=A0A4R6UB88_9ACTN|nr:hypothetical protein [Actinorugispora endophytica]TDQ43918.1 hypothetical protein EV190_13816 [Actinorugispora endophytica]